MIDPAFGLSVFGVCGLIYVVKKSRRISSAAKCRASPPGKAEIDVSGHPTKRNAKLHH